MGSIPKKTKKQLLLKVNKSVLILCSQLKSLVKEKRKKESPLF